MTWTSVFDVGECTVEVYVPAASRLDLSQLMAKGEMQPFTDADYGAMSVAVSANGVVTLTNVDGLGLEVDFEVRVLPAADMASMAGIRAKLPTTISGVGTATSNDTDTVDFVNGDAAADLSAQSSPDRIACTTSTIGSASGSPVIQFTPEVDVPPPPPPVKRLQFEVQMEGDDEDAG